MEKGKHLNYISLCNTLSASELMRLEVINLAKCNVMAKCANEKKIAESPID